nr:formyltransferase family protein [Amycolatopsis anabasis]
MPRFGIFNVHSGLLPQYAGPAAPVHTMLADEPELGVTLHVIDREIDTGPILSSATLPVDKSRSLFGHLPRLYEPGVELFLHELPDLEAGRVPTGRAQDPKARRYHNLPTMNQIAAVEVHGYRLFNTQDYGELVQRFGANRPLNEIADLSQNVPPRERKTPQRDG